MLIKEKGLELVAINKNVERGHLLLLLLLLLLLSRFSCVRLCVTP